MRYISDQEGGTGQPGPKVVQLGYISDIFHNANGTSADSGFGRCCSNDLAGAGSPPSCLTSQA